VASSLGARCPSLPRGCERDKRREIAGVVGPTATPLKEEQTRKQGRGAFEADVFALTIAVKPENEEVDALGLLAQVLLDVLLGVGLLLHRLRFEQLGRVRGVPALVLGHEIRSTATTTSTPPPHHQQPAAAAGVVKKKEKEKEERAPVDVACDGCDLEEGWAALERALELMHAAHRRDALAGGWRLRGG